MQLLNGLREIDSPKNPLIQDLRRLERTRERREQNLFLAEGEKMTREAVSCGLARMVLVSRGKEERYAPLLSAAQAAGAECFSVSENIIAVLSSAKTPQGVLAAAEIPKQPAALTGKKVLALDGVQDPGNVGTMIRTADAAGMDAVLLGCGCADPFGAKAARASMGSLFRMPLFFASEEEPLPRILGDKRALGYAVVSSELGGVDFYTGCPSPPLILVIGSEGNGVSEEVSAAATHRLALPMRGGAESLNAAVAAGIMMYEAVRR